MLHEHSMRSLRPLPSPALFGAGSGGSHARRLAQPVYGGGGGTRFERFSPLLCIVMLPAWLCWRANR